jgi:DNA-3-methyladenine glycosylase II
MPQVILTPTTPEIQVLCSSDPIIKRCVDTVGKCTWTIREDYFVSLVRSIIGQQLSSVAANTIFSRLQVACGGNICPASLLKVEASTLKAAGLSSGKANYVVNLARLVAEEEFDLIALQNLDDADIVKALTAVKGIGTWTAKMFLIFSLGRKDVWSIEDAGLRAAVKRIHGNGELTIAEIDFIADKWKPCRSLVSLYLWEVIDRKLFC